MLENLKVTAIDESSCTVTGTGLFGATVEKTFPVAAERITAWARSDDLIHNSLPELNPTQCEFLLSGLSDQEWDDVMSDSDWKS